MLSDNNLRACILEKCYAYKNVSQPFWWEFNIFLFYSLITYCDHSPRNNHGGPQNTQIIATRTTTSVIYKYIYRFTDIYFRLKLIRKIEFVLYFVIIIQNIICTVGVWKNSLQLSSARVFQYSGIAVPVRNKYFTSWSDGHGSRLAKSPVSFAVFESLTKSQWWSERSGRKLHLQFN